MNDNNLIYIINEEVTDYLIDETYKSVNEVRQLASDVIRSIANNNIDQIKDKGNIGYLFGTYLHAVDHTKYDELANFIKDTNIAITIEQPDQKGARGAYTHIPDIPYDPKMGREIEIFVKDLDELLNKINENIQERGDNYDTQALYLDLFYPLYTSLIHELQHAYDDYRSGGKAYQTKEFTKYRQKYLRNAISNQIQNDMEQALRYVNLPHEIWARFSQAMYGLHFTDMDIEGNRILFEMRPIKSVVNDFKSKYEHFNALKDNMKKKLINKVVQFWHYEQEHLDEKIEKANRR